MTSKKINISSNALVLIGANTISSFTDDSTESKVAALLYENVYLAMLTTYAWRFSIRSVSLAKLSEKPNNGWEWKFQLPEDHLYTVRSSSKSFEIFENQLYTNAENVMIDMVYRVDESQLPAYFTKALEYNLASNFAIPITENVSKADYYRTLYELELKRARFADSSQRPNNVLEDSPYIEVRI